jgi:hypothetical protein
VARFLSDRRAQHHVDPARGSLVRSAEEVRVNIEGHRGVGVSEALADDFDILTRLDEMANVRVAQVVEPDLRQVGRLGPLEWTAPRADHTHRLWDRDRTEIEGERESG